jgi:UDP-glucose 4-epimerase
LLNRGCYTAGCYNDKAKESEQELRIGLIGAGGFIGSYLFESLRVESLRERDPGQLRLFWRNPNVAPPEPAEVVYGDLASYPDCENFARGLDVIYYLAHHNTPVNSDFDQANDTALNLIPLLTLLKAIENLGTRPKLIYFSSGGAVYGAGSARTPFREDQACYPTCSYGVQKLAAEHYLRIAADRGHLSSVVLRVGNAFGTLLPQHRMQGLIGVAVNNVLHDRPVRIFGNPDNVRDYVHLSDVCDLAMRVIAAEHPYLVLNVGSGKGASVREVMKAVEACSPLPVTVHFDSDSGRKLTDWAVLDIAKARQEFRWEPKVTLCAGIADMMHRWGAHPKATSRTSLSQA